MKIQFITDEYNEWEVLKIDGEIYASHHRLYTRDWLNLLKDKFSVDIEETEVTSEEMEMMS